MMHKFMPLSRQRQSRIHSFLSSFCTQIPTAAASIRETPRKFAPNDHSTTTLRADFDIMPQTARLLREMFSRNDHTVIKSFDLSEDMKLRLYDELSRKNGKQLIIYDLLPALLAFAHEPKDGKQYKLMEKIELGIAPFVHELNAGDALNLLTIYCFSCRKHPGESCVLFCLVLC
jgi:hypothetical protein